MKGANVAHAKQRRYKSRYIGITEPGIIAAESPNPIVNHLVIMPDIEKRLEAFLRTGHGVIVFPGGVGTAEEILYLLGLLLQEGNEGLALPVISPAPPRPHRTSSRSTSSSVLPWATRRPSCTRSSSTTPSRSPAACSRACARCASAGSSARTRSSSTGRWISRWSSSSPSSPPTRPWPAWTCTTAASRRTAADLRRAFSGIVAGNVKEAGMRRVEEHGPFRIHGDKDMMEALDALLRAFVAQRRMKISGQYRPCYEVVT